jgi:hypothetical protein
MILVLPFCAKDGKAALKNLLWIEELDGRLPFDCVLSHDTETPVEIVRDMTIVANRVFRKTDVFWYPAPEKKYWPAAPNWAWQNVARYIEAVVKQPWLFLEADAVPIRKGWLQDIATEHERGGRPFSGHIVAGMGHMNGAGVYPPNVSAYSVGAFRTEETAWDVVLGEDLKIATGGVSAMVHPSHTLFQHCWAINPLDGRPWNGAGEVATFRNVHDVIRLVDTTMAVFHRCKDGSLIDWLRVFHRDPSVVMVPQLGAGAIDEQKQSSNQDVRRMDDVAASADPGTVDCVPERKPDEVSATPSPEVASEAFAGRCEIFIVTYGFPTKRASGLTVSDFDWLQWCLRCIRRHCTGFAGITLAIPARDAEALKPIAAEHAKAKGGIPLRIRMFNEPPGKGMLMHMVVMGSADEFVPKDTTHVLHVDSDVMFKEPVTPSDYFVGDKPVYVWRSYASLSEMRGGQVVTSDCAQWKGPTEAQLGLSTDCYGMCRHPVGFPVGFYAPYRNHIAAVHGKPYPEFMLSGRNAFPQDRMDFTAMGAFAHAAMRDKFHWVDISAGNHLAPRDKQKCYWSHGGVTDHIKAEIEGFLK